MSMVRSRKCIDEALGVAAGTAPYSLLDYGAKRGLVVERNGLEEVRCIAPYWRDVSNGAIHQLKLPGLG